MKRLLLIAAAAMMLNFGGADLPEAKAGPVIRVVGGAARGVGRFVVGKHRRARRQARRQARGRFYARPPARANFCR